RASSAIRKFQRRGRAETLKACHLRDPGRYRPQPTKQGQVRSHRDGDPPTSQKGNTVMTSSSPAFVLVPGAWEGGWVWQPVARRLREAGHAAVTITLPGLADGDKRAGLRLTGAVDHVVAEISRRDLSAVVLVGHSWGGYVITGAAHMLAGRLAKVIY